MKEFRISTAHPPPLALQSDRTCVSLFSFFYFLIERLVFPSNSETWQPSMRQYQPKTPSHRFRIRRRLGPIAHTLRGSKLQPLRKRLFRRKSTHRSRRRNRRRISRLCRSRNIRPTKRESHVVRLFLHCPNHVPTSIQSTR